jgi:hypothetical protein
MLLDRVEAAPYVCADRDRTGITQLVGAARSRESAMTAHVHKTIAPPITGYGAIVTTPSPNSSPRHPPNTCWHLMVPMKPENGLPRRD